MSQERELSERCARLFWIDTQDVKKNIKNETELRFLFVLITHRDTIDFRHSAALGFT